MVNSINSVNGATVTTATQAVSKTEKTDEVAKKEEQAKKTTKKKETDKVDKQETVSYAFDKKTLEIKIKDYIEKLKKENDYPVVVDQLNEYLALLDIDKFMKTYPNIATDREFNGIMYNETIKYL